MAGSRALPDLVARLKLDTSDLQKAEQAAGQMGKQIEATANASTSGLRRIQQEAGNTHSAVGGLGQSFGGMVAGVAGGIVAASGFAGVLGTVVGAVRSTITAGIDFGDQMNTLRAVTGATAAQMAQLQQKSIELGNDLTLPNTSAADAARAMTELAKAGLSVGDSMTAAKGTLQLAAAAGVDEATAATLAATALNAFHLQGSEATRVADLLAAAANASAADVTQVGFSMQASAAIFASAKIPIADLVAAIGEMANAGIAGSDAGTSLKEMLLKLQGPSGPASDAMKAIGISIYNAHGQMLPFRDIILNVHNALAKLTPQQHDQAVATIFGSDAARSANIIFGQSVKTFDDMHAAVTKQGAAADVASAKSQGLGGAIRAVQSEMETMSLQIYQQLEPGLEGVAKWAGVALPKAFEQAGRWITQLAGPVAAVLGDFAGLGGKVDTSSFSLKQMGDTVVGSIVPALKFLHDNFAVVEAILAGLTAGFVYLNVEMAVSKAVAIGTAVAQSELAAQMYIAASAEGVLTAAQFGLDVAMAANPIGAVVLALEALVAGVVLAIVYWRQITGAVVAAYNGFAPLQAVVQHVSDAFRVFNAFVAAGYTQTKAFEEGLRALGVPLEVIGPLAWGLNGALDGVRAALSAVRGVIAGVSDFVATFVDRIRHGEQPLSALAGALLAVHTPLGLVEGAMRLLNSVTEGLGRTFAPIGVALRQAGKELAPTFAQLGSSIGAAFGQIKTALAPLGPVFAALVPILGRLAGWLGGQLKTAAMAFGVALGIVGAIIGALIAGVFSGLVAFLTTAIPAAIKVVTGAIQIVAGIITLFVDLFTGRWGKLGADVGTIVNGLVNLVVGGFGLLVQAPLAFVKGFAEGVVGFFTWLYNMLVGHSIVPALVDGVVAWFRNLAAWITAPLQALWGNVNFWFAVVVNTVISATNTAWDHLKSFGAWLQGTFSAILGTLGSVAAGVGQKIGDAFSGLGGAIHGGLSTVAGVIDKFDVMVNALPIIGGILHLPRVPAFAEGGIVTRPTFGVFGEAGPEALIPLGGGAGALALWRQAGEMLGVHGLGAASTTPGDWAGQCVVAVESWTNHHFPVAMASEMTQWVNSSTPAPGEIFVSTLPPFGHTGIVIGGGKVIDSNWGLDERVRIHNLSDIPSIAGYIAGIPAAGLPGGTFDVTSALKGLISRALGGLGGWQGELAGSLLGSVASGASKVFDQGGIWPAGTVGVNASPRDEYVLTREQMAAAGGRSVVNHFHISGQGLNEEQVAMAIDRRLGRFLTAT